MRSVTAFAAVAAAGIVQAQDLNQTIVGCIGVGCPSTDGINDNCTIVDASYPEIGLTRIATSNGKLGGLSWVEGWNATDSSDGRVFHSSFYLATPSGLDLGDTGACSVFFNDATTFPGNNDTSQGTCDDAMPSACVDALVQRAQKLATGFGDNAPSSADACAQLRKDLEDNLDDACKTVTLGSWKNLTSVALTGNGAPTAITAEQNGSSTCWPVTPKDDSLTFVSDFAEPGTLNLTDASASLYAVTPILTLFYPGNGSLITDVDASLTCIKPVGPALASLDTISTGGDDDDSAAGALSTSRVLTGLGLIASIWWVSV
ncbi:hypothetical protein F5Y15DRAFT_255335 [Xylariaceae sp. FL0016]|nr:hypothetical protein F5Y15DRAFT_255335 [Xylariaceae sp. FL0016]